MSIETKTVPDITTKPYWGTANPHPLSALRTELIWEGKYDEYGNRREIDITGCSMPLQKIETIDQPLSQAQANGQLKIFEKNNKRLDDFRNMLIWGDNKLVIASLLSQFRGQIQLIYIDPPFDVGADFTMDVPIGEENDVAPKDQSALEMVAYRDIWGRGTDSYLHMMYERLVLMRELLAEDGSIYVHCDWRVSSFIRLSLDEIFGRDYFRNELIWSYRKFARSANQFPQSHDTIFFYTRDKKNIFNHQFVPLSESTLKRWGSKKRGGKDPNNRFITDEESQGAAMPDVWDIPLSIGANPQATGYPTQKPEALLERILRASSNEGDLIADFFCGSGTTLTVAEKLGRRWIGTDLGRFAIHTSRKRLIDTQRELYSNENSYRSFDVYNLGRYERQWWQKEKLKGADDEHRSVVLSFYNAEALSVPPSPLLHGRKGAAFVHVEHIDSLLTRDELSAIAEACYNSGGKELNCLAWEFEMDLKLIAASLEKQYGLKIKLVTIPREIMEKNRKEPPPFLEVAELRAESIISSTSKQKCFDVKLTKFFPSLAEVSSKELDTLKERAIKNGFDFIDFWAVDFDYTFQTPFKHDWQAYRTRRNRALPLETDASYKYEKPGKHNICIKVIDVFGSDTTITLEVQM